MSAPSDSVRYHVVKNNESQSSIWPDYRLKTLPAGWSFTGISGLKEECLRRIAKSAQARAGAAETIASARPAAAPPQLDATARSGPHGSVPRTRATALPFPRPDAAARLFVFPHAGSGASYYHFLARACKDDPIELHVVQYPGREMRMAESALADMGAMTRLLQRELGPLLAEKPFAFLGHSMGALTAFELTCALRDGHAPLPQHLFLSGRQAPHVAGTVLKVDALDDAAFLEAVGRRYNALPPELLAHPEIVAMILPSLRADFSLMQRYTCRERPPLDIALTLLNGLEDPWIDAASLTAWQRHSTYPLRQHTFPGGHFYLTTAAQQIRTIVLGALALQQR